MTALKKWNLQVAKYADQGGHPTVHGGNQFSIQIVIQLQLSLSDGRKHNFLTAKAGNSLSCRL